MNNTIKRTWNQNSMVIIEDLQGMAFQAESGGHTFQISGIDGEGNAVALSGTPAGVMLRADGQDVTLTCSVSGGVVSATLPANAYSVPGRFGLTIFLTSDGQKTAIYAAVGTVSKTSSGTVAPPAGSDVVDLVNAIATAVATIPASYTDLMASVAPTYSSSGLYAVGSYSWNNGKLYRCNTPITTAETWTAAHWTLANLGSDLVDLKSALSVAINNGDTLIEKSVNWQAGYISTSGLINNSSLSGFALVKLYKGETVRIGTKNSNITIIGSTTQNSLSVGDSVTVIQTTPPPETFTEYSYTASDEINIVLCVRLSDYRLHFEKASEIIKSDGVNLLDLSMAGKGTLSRGLFGVWCRGYVDGSNGTVKKTLTYRICQETIDKKPYDLNLSVGNGFTINVSYYNNGVFSSTDFSITGSYTIAKNTEYRITIKRSTDDTSEIADFDTFLGAIAISSNVIDLLQKNIGNNSELIGKLADFYDDNYLSINWEDISLSTYLNTNGTTSGNSAYWTSDYIPVKPSQTYSMWIEDKTSGSYHNPVYLGNVVYFKTNTGVLTSGTHYEQNVASFTTPSDCKYIRIARQYLSSSGSGSSAGIDSSNYLTDDYIINHSAVIEGTTAEDMIGAYQELSNSTSIKRQNPLYGKKVYVIGDSFIEMGYVTGAIVNKTGCLLTNYGIGGTRLADYNGTYTNAICNRISAMSNDAPALVLVEGGSNDCGATTGTPLGTVGESEDKTTLAGAVYSIVSQLSAKYPGVPIVFSTMPYRWYDGQTYKQYATVVKQECEYLGIPCLFAWGECGFNEFNRDAYNYNNDGIHVNALGGKRFADAWLSKIYQAVGY